MTAHSTDDLLAEARSRITRVEPEELDQLVADGALVVDIRPAAQRAAEGELGFGLIVERNVLEWRFDLTGSHALPEVTGYDQPIVVVCSEGYASSLAADSLRQLGFARAADLAGGYHAWRRWRTRARPAAPDATTSSTPEEAPAAAAARPPR
jgi:rhodanese-related sulfurtransferase